MVVSVQTACNCSRVVAEMSIEESRSCGEIHADSQAEHAIRVASERIYTQGKALHEALVAEDLYSAQLLLNNGDVDLGVCGSWGCSGYQKTPLMLAVQLRQYRMAKEMCELIVARTAGAGDVDARDQQGRTALGIAREKGYPEMCALLLANGADESKSLPQKTPYVRLSNVDASPSALQRCRKKRSP